MPAVAHGRQPVYVADREALKPIGIRADSGMFVTLAEFSAEPSLGVELASLASLDYEKQAEFAIARLAHEPETLRVGILGEREFTRDEIIKEIEAGSPIGKQFVQVEQAWVERVKAKLSRGEYKLRAEAGSASGR